MKSNYFCWTIILFISLGLIRQSVEEKALTTEQKSAKNGDWAVQLESLLKSMLVTECQMLAQNSNDLNDAPLVVEEEVKRGCDSLLNGQQLSVDGTKIVGTVTLECQTGGQQMVVDLKQWEIETKKMTVSDGLQGAVAEGILPQANEHSKKLLQQFVALTKFLGVVENKMSAGLAKDAIHAVLTQKSLPLPSEMMQLVIQLWLKVFNGGEHQTEAVQQKQHQHIIYKYATNFPSAGVVVGRKGCYQQGFYENWSLFWRLS